MCNHEEAWCQMCKCMYSISTVSSVSVEVVNKIALKKKKWCQMPGFTHVDKFITLRNQVCLLGAAQDWALGSSSSGITCLLPAFIPRHTIHACAVASWLGRPPLDRGVQVRALGPVSLKPWKLFEPVKPLQNLEPCDYRAVYSHILKMKGGFLHTRSFQAYTLLRF